MALSIRLSSFSGLVSIVLDAYGTPMLTLMPSVIERVSSPRQTISLFDALNKTAQPPCVAKPPEQPHHLPYVARRARIVPPPGATERPGSPMDAAGSDSICAMPPSVEAVGSPARETQGDIPLPLAAATVEGCADAPVAGAGRLSDGDVQPVGGTASQALPDAVPSVRMETAPLGSEVMVYTRHTTLHEARVGDVCVGDGSQGPMHAATPRYTDVFGEYDGPEEYGGFDEFGGIGEVGVDDSVWDDWLAPPGER